MRFNFPILVLWGVLLVQPINTYAQAGNRPGALATLSETGTLYGVSLDRNRRDDARENMVELAGQLQALYDLGGTSASDSEVQDDVQDRSQVLAEAVNSLIDIINDVNDPPEAAPPVVPDENYEQRTLRLVTSYLDLVDTLTLFINGEDVEIEDLNKLRAGLTSIEAITATLPESEF